MFPVGQKEAGKLDNRDADCHNNGSSSLDLFLMLVCPNEGCYEISLWC